MAAGGRRGLRLVSDREPERTETVTVSIES
jgi:hypothetical protein